MVYGPVSLDIIAQDPQSKFDRRIKYPWNDKLLTNAMKLRDCVNLLYTQLPVNLRGNFYVTSAYRPGHYNEIAGGAPGSLHTTCEAIDLANVGNVLGEFLLSRQEILEASNLWMEHPEATLKTAHLHLQIRPPRSGNRVFWP